MLIPSVVDIAAKDFPSARNAQARSFVFKTRYSSLVGFVAVVFF